MNIKVELRIAAIKSILSDDLEIKKWSAIMKAAADEIIRLEEALATTERAYREQKERADTYRDAITVLVDRFVDIESGPHSGFDVVAENRRSRVAA